MRLGEIQIVVERNLSSDSAAHNRYSDILAYWKNAGNAAAQQRGHDLLPEDFDCETAAG